MENRCLLKKLSEKFDAMTGLKSEITEENGKILVKITDSDLDLGMLSETREVFDTVEDLERFIAGYVYKSNDG